MKKNEYDYKEFCTFLHGLVTEEMRMRSEGFSYIPGDSITIGEETPFFTHDDSENSPSGHLILHELGNVAYWIGEIKELDMFYLVGYKSQRKNYKKAKVKKGDL